MRAYALVTGLVAVVGLLGAAIGVTVVLSHAVLFVFGCALGALEVDYRWERWLEQDARKDMDEVAAFQPPASRRMHVCRSCHGEGCDDCR